MPTDKKLPKDLRMARRRREERRNSLTLEKPRSVFHRIADAAEEATDGFFDGFLHEIADELEDFFS